MACPLTDVITLTDLININLSERLQKCVYLIRPAKDGKWKQGRREPRIEHIGIYVKLFLKGNILSWNRFQNRYDKGKYLLTTEGDGSSLFKIAGLIFP